VLANDDFPDQPVERRQPDVRRRRDNASGRRIDDQLDANGRRRTDRRLW
jgi:hypothetical protein